ncbi:MAG TPA: transcription termination factor Rho [Acidimicrobiales bacterium]|nr:transcription termination factor Rho [Acidimicrobiales bacterium]
MSAEQTTLERSALERKDREELTTIAQALGAKPPSRARKADIVQLILELTGVEPSRGGDTAGGGASDRQEATVDEAETPAPAGEPEVAAERPDQDPTPAPTGGGPGGEPPSEWEMEFGGTTDVVEPAVPAAGKGKANGNGNRNRNGESGHGDARQADARQADDRQADDRQADDRQPDDRQADDDRQAEGGQAPGGAQGGGKPGEVADNDQGNRRRRRRGRRGKDDAPQAEEFSGEPVEVEGLLDLRDEGYGFLRVKGYLPSKDDIYVSVKQVRQFGLRKGDHVRGASRPAMRNEKNPALLRIDTVNGLDPEQARRRRRFEDLTPLFPDEKLSLETVDDPTNMTARIVDLIAPIGKGQRGLIVSPPKAGKTAIVKQVARSIETNNPEVKLMVLLVDERPEEVTDMRRWLRGETSEVVASTFDRPSEEHTQVAELTIERAKRLVEDGRDVCIILDGITRLARAYNLAAPATGRIMSGGVDSGALYPPKKFFGAARNIEEGGSLTILATALIETGSKMDEVIFEEFKGTGNMELRLDRRLAERRVYPAIDVDASSTRHEELLFPRQQLQLVWALRRVLSGLSSTDGGNAAALELLIDRMKTFRANDEFLAEVAKNRLAAG